MCKIRKEKLEWSIFKELTTVEDITQKIKDEGGLKSVSDKALDKLTLEAFTNSWYKNTPALLTAYIAEKQSRSANREAKALKIISKTAIGLSVVAICISAYFSYTTSENSKEWQTTQTAILKEIKELQTTQTTILKEIKDKFPTVEE